MESPEKMKQEYYTIDILHIIKYLWRRAWLIAICGVLAAAAGFSYAKFVIAPTYSSSIKLYVNNNSFSLGNSSFSISASELSAAQSLVKTYGEILNSRSTLERVAEKAKVDYSWKDLEKMIKYSAANETEIMRVTVTCEDPYEASKISNAIAEVLQVRISEVIDGASMEVVDSAIPDLEKVAPSITKYTAIAGVIGVLIICMILVVQALMDDTIHDEEYILKNYDCPILGKVPDLMTPGDKSYSYYSQKNHKKSN